LREGSKPYAMAFAPVEKRDMNRVSLIFEVFAPAPVIQ
jgi:hypothetical protein